MSAARAAAKAVSGAAPEAVTRPGPVPAYRPRTLVLKLFDQADPAVELATRTFAGGELAIGRGPGVDWAIPDPSKGLSRVHCVLALQNGVLAIRDASTNGVFLDTCGRIARGAPTPLAVGETLRLGRFLLRIEPGAQENPAPPPATAEPDAALPAEPRAAAESQGALLEAFCAGAHLDASVLSAEDPAEVMRRLGAVYRQMVLGLSQLMAERTVAKARYSLEWTTVQAIDNNPFRWAPPQRVAIDLLQARQDGFLDGEAAVRASFDDLLSHQQGLMAGCRAAIDSAIEDLGPDHIAETPKPGAFLRSRADALWSAYVERHAEVRREVVTVWGEGSVTQAFRTVYHSGGALPPLAPKDPAGD